ncbi:MAG: lamin tail domain-containing protein [Gammaproteobacteria bacterium]
MNRKFVQASVPAVLVFIASAIVFSDLQGIDQSSQQPGESQLRLRNADSLLSSRFGRFEFRARDGNRLSAEVYRSTGFDEMDGPIWFVMHGMNRDSDRYIATAAPVAERYGALAISIAFSKDDYPRSEDYTLGVTWRGRADGGALKQRRWRAPEDYLYAEIEYVFEAVRHAINGQQRGFFIFGHSAGAQFTHRLMTFLPDSPVLGAVAANAGWYTLPVIEEDPDFTMPYGLWGSPVSEAETGPLVSAPLVILVGERDTKTPDNSRSVRGTPQAMRQGSNRLARGQFYYSVGRDRADALGADFGWRLEIVPRAKHSAAQMLPSAGYFLFSPNQPACISTPAEEASGVIFSEILVRPPDGSAGDANADGRRERRADQFVEIINTSDEPVCLTGWALGDASKPERHVFPLGRPLQPGGALVVFGGGVPTGRFSDAQVQWAAFGGKLGLNRKGDVLTLQDAAGQAVIQFSWGDCAGAVCAREHVSQSLDFSGSLVRVQQDWFPHSDLFGTPFSPGLISEGGT